MRKLVFSMVLASAALTAAPASAQYWRLSRPVYTQIQRDINQLAQRIDRADQRGRISDREAYGLRRDALQTQRLFNRYARNGLDRREVADLELRVNRIHSRLRYERRDWDGRRG